MAPNRKSPRIPAQEPRWWTSHEDYKLDADTNMLIPVGKEQSRFRLDTPEFFDQLRKDLITSVNTIEDAEHWIRERGFLTKYDATQPLEFTVGRAVLLRSIIRLNTYLCDAELGLDEDLERYAEGFLVPGGKFVFVRYCSLNLTYEVEFNEHPPQLEVGDWAMPLGLVVLPKEWKSDPAWCRKAAAKNVLVMAVNEMIAGIKIRAEINWPSLDAKPEFTPLNPWQAIGISLMQLICSNSVQRFCLRCKVPITGRADKMYCDKEACRKWGRRQGNTFRKGGS